MMISTNRLCGTRCISRCLVAPIAIVLICCRQPIFVSASITCVEKLFDDDEKTTYPNHTQFRYYHCPGRFPSDHTRCCHLDQQRCCPTHRRFYEIDRTWAIVISVTVSLLCLLVGLSCIICCFWRRCPLWTCCRPQPKHDVAFADQYEKVPNAPPEENCTATYRHVPVAAAATMTNGHQNANTKAPLASLASTNASQDCLDA
ncbi:uncharacterized protein LOC111264589 isoform X1 [Varroa jacobsoni]|uniref:Uncharacterized protein n=1 Tax=Varroa destructor TaxID=109461 RepID=A0A7M7JJE6_VARDE|nr:uncharacterized protein LOC111246931 isoform X1 [Varroa destructor]XP_022696383.1 uncharacterized protein LOC111264589 isoform X1 [Varroa jacobsoni]